MSQDTVGVAIGTTNAYVAVNGQMVANADGHRNTTAMVSQDGDVGNSALQKWVRQPDSILARDGEQAGAFWEGLLNGLAETIRDNVPQGLDGCLCNILIQPTDNRKTVETIAQKIFKNVQILSSENQLLLSQRYKPTSDSSPASICVLKLGGNSCKISKILYTPETQLFSAQDSAQIPIGGRDCIGKIVEFASDEFKRKTRGCQEGINARGKRKLFRQATQAIQTLSNSIQANLYVEAIWEGMDLNTKISKSRFEDLVRPMFVEVLEKLGDLEGVSELILLGGASNIPLFQSLLKQKFPQVTILEAEATLATTASQLTERLPQEHTTHPEISLKTTPCEIKLGNYCLVPKGAPLPIARHGCLTLEYPDDATQVKLALEAAGHGSLTEQLSFEKCTEGVAKSAKNPSGRANQLFYYVSYCETEMNVHLQSSKNTYEFSF